MLTTSNSLGERASSSTQAVPRGSASTSRKGDGAPETREAAIFEAPMISTASGSDHEEYCAYCEAQESEHEAPMTLNRFMSFVGMAFLWTSAQIPCYLYGGIAPIIYSDIGGMDRWVWFITGNLIASAGICPFVGALSDLLGRRYVAMVGCLMVLGGQIICGIARDMDYFIAGMTISGVGAGISELTALAGTAEMAPTAKRGTYVAALVFTILPFCPSVMWAQLIAHYADWRYVAALTCPWTAAGLMVVALFYHPPPRVNSQGLPARAVLARVDFVGGFLSIAGITLFVVGLLWGGYQYPWTSPYVLATVFAGMALVTAFVVWEARFAAHPMFPRRLGRSPRTLVLTLVMTFISGANFFAVLMVWPSQAYNVYGHDPVGVGLRGLPFGLGVLAGCVAALLLLSRLRGGNKGLLLGASCLMTAGCGAMAAARADAVGPVYAVLLVAGAGVGGIVVPASVVTTIICPDDLVATATALALAVRVVGGAIGFTVYFNVFAARLAEALPRRVGAALAAADVVDAVVVAQAVHLTAASTLEPIAAMPAVARVPGLYDAVVAAGRLAYAEAYPYVYYASIAFGLVSILASLFLDDVQQYMDNHVAVVLR